MTIDERLAAYADDALEPAERAEVEGYLAEHPDAAAEVEALRHTLNHVRAAQLRPTREPDWDAMAAAIRDRIEPAVVPLRARILRPRVLAPALAAAAALFLALWWSRGEPAPTAATTEPTEPPTEVATAAGELRAAEVIDLDPDELDALLRDLDPEALVDGDELAIDPVLEPEAVDAWTDDEPMPPATDFELFAEPDYDAWLDTLGADELSALDAYLAAQSG